MKSSIERGDNRAAESEFTHVLDGGDDFRVTNEGFDRIHLTSSAAIHASQDSLTPTSFTIGITEYNELEGNAVDSADIDSTTVATPCQYHVDTRISTPHPQSPAMSTPHTNSPRRCNTAPWDERMNWSKSKSRRHRRSFRSVQSDGSSTTSESSVSTQLLFQPPFLRPAAALQRNISTSTSSSSLSLSDYSVGEHELPPSDRDQPMLESRNPIFFSPRRRLNSLVHTNNRNATLDSSALSAIPMAVVSIPILTDLSTNSIHDDRSQANLNGTEGDGTHENISRGTWCLFASQRQRNNAYQRRNLLFLFLIAAYTTFGLASPDIQKAASTLVTNSKIGNVVIIDDAPTVQGEPLNGRSNNINDVSFGVDSANAVLASATAVDVTSSQLRGSTSNVHESNPIRNDASVINSHLSFARAGGSNANANSNHPTLLIYRRREMNDFYHQPALLQEDTTATTSWYLNCFVLFIIAIYYIVREHKKVFLLCTTSDRSGGASSSIIHNTHHL